MSIGDTDVSICSDALILLGAEPISSFADGSPTATICKTLYQRRINTLTAMHPWRWSMQKAKLARLDETPVNQWEYAYQLPIGHISGVRALFNSGETSAMPKNIGWEIFGNRVLTDFDEVYIDYQVLVPESRLPGYFVELLVIALAAVFAIPVTDQTSKAAMWNEQAFGTPSENGRGGQFRTAMRIHSQSQLPQIIVSPDLIDGV